MAPVTCTVCKYEHDALMCPECGAPRPRRSRDTSTARTAPATPAAVADPETMVDTRPTRCPSCGGGLSEGICMLCVAVPPAAPARDEALGSTSRDQQSGPCLRLTFDCDALDVRGRVILGREADPRAGFLAVHDNVSRTHASVEVDADGRAWARDEGSTNGTFVNDRRLRVGERAALASGDLLRMAKDVVARVDLRTGQ